MDPARDLSEHQDEPASKSAVQPVDPFRAALRRARVVPLPERERRFLESIERRSTTKISLDDLVYQSKHA